MNWKTKPTDRFVLKFIKTYISAPITKGLLKQVPYIKPGVITLFACCTGICGGVAFGMGWGWAGGLLAAVAQVMDGVDGQVARLTGKDSAEGAFLDSVLDRYMDFSLLFGILLYCLRFSNHSPGLLVLAAGLATAGSSQVSYATARAKTLKLNYARPEYAGKGSRTTVIIISGLLSPFWIHFPLMALIYLTLHPNIAIIVSLVRLKRRVTDQEKTVGSGSHGIKD